VIPQRLYYLGLQRSEALINEAYALRDELEQLAEYIATYYDKAYEGYAKYLVSDEAILKNSKIKWCLGKTSKEKKQRTLAFQQAFSVLHS
ncbi:site-specific integrase, partial [Vibrio parahaemolyticus]|nr:site-specific integrase [Vibrio parahaemolyticus]